MTARRANDSVRAHAGRVIHACLDGRALNAELLTDMRIPPTQVAAVQAFAYGVIRWLPSLERLNANFLARPLKPQDRDLHALLLVAWYDLLHMETPPHAVVNEAVDATPALGKPWARALINGVLRSGLRRGIADLRTLINATPEGQWAHPRWWLDTIQASWPDDWADICRANNTQAPLSLRINCRNRTRAEYLVKLGQAGIGATTAAECGLILERALAVDQLPGFADGECSVQDVGAQFAAPLLDVPPRARVLDACAAPGGKTAHLLERYTDVQVTALDRDAKRLGRVQENAARLGLTAGLKLQVADAAATADWWDGAAYTRILLDAPCSGSGVIRRHPDIKVHRRAEDLPRLAAEQRRLLHALWPLLERGGKLLYVTCSILKEENDAAVESLLDSVNDCVPIALEIPSARTTQFGRQILPGTEQMDGFYYAALQKN